MLTTLPPVLLQEVHGLTLAATPQQNINVLTLGAKNGKGGFFPKGGSRYNPCCGTLHFLPTTAMLSLMKPHCPSGVIA